jgi:nucleoside-diphosphate-sugar epimerase
MAMRVFVTGASGYLGSAISARLAKSGHDVRGLTRSEERARRLTLSGVQPVLGDLDSPESFLAELKNCDAVVHVAFDGTAPAEKDERALEAVRVGCQDGRVRRLLYTSGVWVHGDTGEEVADESAPLAAAEASAWRPAHEEEALELCMHDVEVVVLRPGVVYGGTGGILGEWFEQARDRGSISYPGGDQHWSMVHRDDVAEAYLLGLEHAHGGECYLLVDGSHLTVRELAEAAGRAAEVETRALDHAAVIAELGPYGAALLMDQRFHSAKARRELGWVPAHTSFVTEAQALYREWNAGRTAVA